MTAKNNSQDPKIIDFPPLESVSSQFPRKPNVLRDSLKVNLATNYIKVKRNVSR